MSNCQSCNVLTIAVALSQNSCTIRFPIVCVNGICSFPIFRSVLDRSILSIISQFHRKSTLSGVSDRYDRTEHCMFSLSWNVKCISFFGRSNNWKFRIVSKWVHLVHVEFFGSNDSYVNGICCCGCDCCGITLLESWNTSPVLFFPTVSDIDDDSYVLTIYFINLLLFFPFMLVANCSNYYVNEWNELFNCYSIVEWRL